MRVLHVVASNQARGAETFALDLIGDLNRHGVEQRVAVVHPVGNGLDFGIDQVPLTGSRPIAMGRLNRLVRVWGPDVVQAHGGESLKWLTPTLVFPASPPVVYRRIGMTPDWMAGSRRKRAHGFIIRRAARIVAVAEAAARQLTDEFGIEASSIEVIGNAVDERRVRSSASPSEVRKRLGLAQEAPVVLFAGAFTEEKDPLALVEVAARVCDEFPQVTFVMAGEGPLHDELHATVARAGLKDRVRLVGSRTDLPDLMRASSALVLTSRTEGIPGVAIEAGLAGLPVVAYGVGGVTEVVVHGHTGLVARHREPGELASLLIRVLTDSTGAELLGETAKARCRELYEIRRCGTRYLDLYRRLGGAGVRRSADETSTQPLQESLDEI
jgi:L-malate glycosyltransferase